ncbi:MAG: SoxR reducing system RseC family protein [Gammaproteobacteria bacterium]|jgi:positive regulator of sigma E activity
MPDTLSNVIIPTQSLDADAVVLSPADLPPLEACSDAEYLIQAACVRSAAPGGVWVVAQRPKQCSRCANQGGCGVGLLSRWWSQGEQLVFAKTTMPLPPGSWIWLGFPKADFLRSVFMLYCWPIVLLLLGGFAGLTLSPDAWPTDLKSAVGMGLGAFCGALMTYYWSRRRARATSVVVLWPKQF